MKSMTLRAGEARDIEIDSDVAAALPVGRAGSAYEQLVGVLGEPLARRLCREKLGRRGREDLQAMIDHYLDEQNELAGSL